MVKCPGLFLWQRHRQGRISHSEEMVGGQACSSCIDFFGEVVDNVFDVLDHVNHYLPLLQEVKYHSQVVMYLPSVCGDGHSVGLAQPLSKLCHLLWIHIGDLQIVHVPADGHLSAVHCLVCNAWIIWVHLESSALQVGEFLVKK
jgi:hypothetical protein